MTFIVRFVCLDLCQQPSALLKTYPACAGVVFRKLFLFSFHPELSDSSCKGLFLSPRFSSDSPKQIVFLQFDIKYCATHDLRGKI